MKLKTERLEKKDINRIVEILNAGGIVALPTDTVYGLAVKSDRFDAINKMKIAKQRPETKPFPMMVNHVDQIEMVANIGYREYQLIKKWMPGAITMIFEKKDRVDEIVTNGYKTIGIRMPDDEFVLSIINQVKAPLLVPSANISGEPSCTTSDEVLKQLDGRIDAIVVGESGAMMPSTIIDCTKQTLSTIRQGKITLEEIIESIREN